MMANESQQQPYDNLLKRLLENQPTTVIPLLLNDGALQIIEELNIEVLLPPRRTDRVYRSVRNGKMKIIHFEFESTPNPKMDRHLLIYHALLLEKYDHPIKSTIVYPFDISTVCSPLQESDDIDGDILTFHYKTLPLAKLDAREYIERRAVPLYGFLPAMQHTTDDLLLYAIEQMIQYYKNNEERLRDELLCFKVLLERAKRLPEEHLQHVLRRIHMFDPLLEQDPWIQELKAHERAQGREIGFMEGELRSSRSILVNIVRKRFPSLTAMAEVKAAQIDKPEAISVLIEQVSLTADENAAHKVLESYVAS